MPISDSKQRETALDISKSLIVQAPAGSGKTSLLVQRFLTLLAQASTPEEIVAITFTKKAAAEIKDRIINLITSPASFTTDVHKNKIYTVAHQAYQRNQEKNWHLLENPNRLKIQTIDALSYSIIKQAPILSQLGATEILENQKLENCYLRAITALFDHPTSALKNLLLHLNNDLRQTENLLLTLLKKREQWLPYIVTTKNNPKQFKAYLENTLSTIVNESIEKCSNLLESKFPTIIDLAQFSNNILQLIDFKNNNFCMVLEHWEFIAKMLLTKKFTWRKSVDAKNGFPAASSTKNKTEKELFQQKKEQLKSLLDELQENESIRQNLEDILNLPATTYSVQEWNLVLSLCELLPLLVAELKLIFQQEQAVDYAEILMAADYALGLADNPSELALNLDYKIQHLLVDEFQDTSLAQYRLIEKLIAGWQPNDGHTLFIVGDPMQSIYRFRQAEVGLFLRAQTEKIGAIQLAPITLSTNFRANQTIIDWINANFQKILPKTSNINYGAIPFTPSVAANTTENNQSIQVQLLTDGTESDEAQHLINIIKKIQSNNATEKTAILVRSRTHLNKILPALNQAHINYQAVELENLSANPVIQDLFALTRALLDLTDRIAWLAILRAPWCGLSLKDLHAIANWQHALIIENLNDYKNILNLSPDAKIRLAKFVPIIVQHLNYVQRKNVSSLVENTWHALAGNTCIDASEIETAELFFKLLTHNDQNGTVDPQFLERSLNALFATTNAAATMDLPLQIITIHKAKGLEFDHVIIPGINRTSKNDSKDLLLWTEYLKQHQGNGLLLAPMASSEDKNKTNKIYDYLWYLEQQKTRYETGRLLYVAMTRAKKSVHLIGTTENHANKNNNKINSIEKNSLLSQLTSSFDENWIIPCSSQTQPNTKPTHITIERLSSDFNFPKIKKLAEYDTVFKPIDDNASVGTLIHKYLEKISNEGFDQWNDNYILVQRENFKRALIQEGCWDIEKNLAIVIQALRNTINDPRGRWILDQYPDSHSEYKITAIFNDEIKSLVIDRTFTDDGKTWIIDYKTSTPNTDLNTFLEQQKLLYQAQLEEYAAALQRLENRPIHLGLYFPLCQGWIEWGKDNEK